MYKNKLTGELWCMSCLAIEKKIRNQIQWDKRFKRGEKDAKN